MFKYASKESELGVKKYLKSFFTSFNVGIDVIQSF